MPKNNNHCPAPLWAGQNFLTSGAVIRRLVDCSDIDSQDLVLEIGPGKGHITRELLARCGSLVATELDPALCRKLQERFGEREGFRLRQGDFLKMPLPPGAYKVFANIPFSHTTGIVHKLTRTPNPPECAWLIVERGAAKRFAGKPRESLASLSMRPFFQVRIAALVPRDAFHPAPRVDAALLELRLKKQPDLPMGRQASYLAFVERGWKQGFRGLLTPRQISTALKRAGLPLPGEDANMKYVQWLCLFRAYQAYKRGF